MEPVKGTMKFVMKLQKGAAGRTSFYKGGGSDEMSYESEYVAQIIENYKKVRTLALEKEGAIDDMYEDDPRYSSSPGEKL